MMDQDQVLQLVKTKGPVIPSQISKDMGTNILLASAMLSELASRSAVKISSVKVGGSPLYYVQGQEEKLQQYMNSMHEIEKRACEMLKNRQVLRDDDLEPAARVALRQCKDFAKPLEVTASGQKQIFWKWYMVPAEQVEELIRRELSKAPPKLQAETKPLQQPQKQEKEKQIQAETAKEPVQGSISQQIQEALQQRMRKAEKQAEKLMPAKQFPKPAHDEAISAATFQKAEPQKPKQKKAAGSAFTAKISEFFKEKKITILEEEHAKATEASYLVRVPSSVGELVYLCIAKNKAKCQETDLSYAYVQGQIRKLPVLLITTGEPTKKAQELLHTKEFSNLTLAKV